MTPYFDNQDAEPVHQRLARELADTRRLIFDNVIAVYQAVMEMPCLGAIQMDRTARPNGKFHLPSLAFRIDVERATAKALQQPEDQAAWFAYVDHCLVKEDIPPTPLDHAIVQRCGQVYQQLRLDPREYFAPIRRQACSALGAS